MLERATGDTAPITALVCTAGRPDMVVRSISSILANTHPLFEVFVVDQSTDRATADALAPLLADPRVHYVQSTERGKGAALNTGLAMARTEIVACTDDDCIVAADWLDSMAAAFAGRPQVAIVFGAVAPVPHDRSRGYVPAYEPRADRLVMSLRQKASARGIGACMGLRRSAIVALGGFDPGIGPGGTFRAGDDWDIAARALIAGYAVFETPSVRVTHDGFRTFEEGRVHARRDWYGIGAVCAKPVRAGHPSAALVAAQVFVGDAVWPPVRDLLHLRRPVGIARIVAFAAGFARGLRTPVHQDTLVFHTRMND